jgi:hypothetical protein
MDAVTTEPRWGLGDVAIGLIPFYLEGLGLLLGGSEGTPTVGGVIVSELFLWLFILGVPLVATYRKGNGVVRDLGFRMERRDLPIGFPLGIAVQLFVAAPLVWLALWATHQLDDPSAADSARKLTDAFSGWNVVILVVLVVIAAPIIEEIFFRGLVLRSFERRLGSGWAVFLSAALFAVGHFEGIETLPLFVFGVLLAWMALRTKRLGLGIAAHMGFNAWTVFALLALNWR